jgi:hypothetical protein
MTKSKLKRLIFDFIMESKVAASASYMKKEEVRQAFQNLVTQKVASGEISDQESLDEWFASAEMSLKALKMVPIAAYQATSPKRSRRK